MAAARRPPRSSETRPSRTAVVSSYSKMSPVICHENQVTDYEVKDTGCNVLLKNYLTGIIIHILIEFVFCFVYLYIGA